MNDMAATIVPKSNQTNADDFITGPRTITVSRVEVRPGQEQPVSVHYEGDNGKPYKPCKSMCRVIVQAWGADSANYPGKSMTLYRDEDVTWGGMKVGGIRISHMSHIDRDLAMALSVSKSKRQMVMVKRLQTQEPRQEAPQPKPETATDDWPKFMADMEYAITNATDGKDIDLIMRNNASAVKRLKEADAEALNRLRGLTVTRREEIKAEMEQKDD
jgi:hypothetical protein